MIAEATFGSRSTHASANCGRSKAGFFGNRLQLLHRAQHVRLHQPVHEAAHLSLAARLSRGGGLSVVLAGKHTLTERRPDDLRNTIRGAERDDLVLRLAP